MKQGGQRFGFWVRGGGRLDAWVHAPTGGAFGSGCLKSCAEGRCKSPKVHERLLFSYTPFSRMGTADLLPFAFCTLSGARFNCHDAVAWVSWMRDTGLWWLVSGRSMPDTNIYRTRDVSTNPRDLCTLPQGRIACRHSCLYRFDPSDE